jgi:hypothetical protein
MLPRRIDKRVRKKSFMHRTTLSQKGLKEVLTPEIVACNILPYPSQFIIVTVKRVKTRFLRLL